MLITCDPSSAVFAFARYLRLFARALVCAGMGKSKTAAKSCAKPPAKSSRSELAKHKAPTRAFEPSKIRRPSRRDEIVRAQRVISLKLKSVHADIIQTIVGKQHGLTVVDYIVEFGFRKQRRDSQYLASSFWTSFHEEYDVSPDLFQHMPKPSGDLVVRDILLEALATACHENPSLRDCVPFVDFLKYHTESLNLAELTVACKNSLQDERITEDRSLRMLCAILKHIGKFEIDKKESHWWSTCASDFDTVMVRAWKSGLFSNGGRHSFLVSHRDSLSPFLDKDALAEVVHSISQDNGAALSARAVHTLMESQIGKVLFKPECAKIELVEFGDAAERGIVDCEYHSFSKDEVDAFYKKMSRSVETLLQAGHKAFATKETLSVDFLLVKIEAPHTGLQSQWSVPLATRVKQIAINNGMLKRLPWEVLLFGESGFIGDLPQSIAVPLDLEVIVDCGNARAAAMKCFKGVGDATNVSFADMRKAIAPQRASLLSHESTFYLELDFLMLHAEKVADARVREQMLATLPDRSETPSSMSDAFSSLRSISSSRLCLACDVALDKDCGALMSLVQNLIDGTPPSAKLISQGSDFFRKAVFKMGNWCMVENKKAAKLKKGEQEPKYLFGADAAAQIYTVTMASKAKTHIDMAPLRRFKWLLSPEKQIKVDQVVKQLNIEKIPGFAKPSVCHGQLAIEAGIGDGCAASGAASSSASGASSALVRKRSGEITASIADGKLDKSKNTLSAEKRAKFLACLY